MKAKKEKRMKTETLKATSLKLPEALWKAVHIRAMDENVDFRDIVRRALEMYLKTSKAKQ